MTDQIVSYEGKQYLVRDGEVFLRLRKWWSSKPEHVSPATRTAILKETSK